MIRNHRPYQLVQSKTGCTVLALGAALAAKLCGTAFLAVRRWLVEDPAKLPSAEEARSWLQQTCPKPSGEAQFFPLPPMDPAVDLSVIVPAFNAQATIEACLRSILDQKTKYRIQIVVIDSDSTDNTPELLHKYSGKPGLVLTCTQGPRSAARARNQGLRYAAGRYLMFVDSDDQLLPGSIEILLDAAEKLQADLVQGSWQYLSADGRPGLVQNYVRQCYTGHCALDRFDLPGMPWGKVYRRELFERVRFPSGYSCVEDSIIHFLILRSAKKPVSIPETVYLWRKNPAGITARCQNKPEAAQSYWIMEELLAQDAALGLPRDALFGASLTMQLSNYCYANLARADKTLQQAVFRLCCELYASVLPQGPGPGQSIAVRFAARALRQKRFGLWCWQGKAFRLL